MHNYKMGKLLEITLVVTAFVWMSPLCLAAVKHSHAKAVTHKKMHVQKKIHKTKNYRQLHSTKKHPAATSANIHALMNANRIIQSNLPRYLLTDSEMQLVNTVYDAIANLRYSTYKLGGTRIDTTKGIYVVDCSAYVDHVLNSVYPRAYSSLVNWSGSQKPTSDDYYQYFTNLGYGKHHWNAIRNVGDLRPGDVLVFRKNSQGNYGSGHVMLVMDKPKRDANHYTVRVSDAAPAGHSRDTRLPHTSGIGVGTLMLKVNPITSHPYAYAWREGNSWKDVAIAMARPKEIS